MKEYLYSIIGGILTGLHLFGIKYSATSTTLGTTKFYFIAGLSLLTWLISRIFVYLSSLHIPITITHMILNLSIIISTICSILVYETKINYILFSSGIIIKLLGLYCIEKSVSYTNILHR